MSKLDEDIVIEYLREHELATTDELATYFGVSWNTIDAFLKHLEIKGYVNKKRLGRINVWYIKKQRPDFWFEVSMRLTKRFIEFGKSDCGKDTEELSVFANIFAKQVGRELSGYFNLERDKDIVIREIITKICYEMSSPNTPFEIEIEQVSKDRYRVIARQCPLFHFSAEEPILCKICNGLKTGIIENLLKRPVTIENVKSMPKGDRYCELNIVV